jgi:hypothetical protein
MAEMRESNKELVEGRDYIKPLSGLNIKVNVDCSEALKGLKAITREAKKATAALKELEVAQKNQSKNITINISPNTATISAKELEEQLNKLKLNKEWI